MRVTVKPIRPIRAMVIVLLLLAGCGSGAVNSSDPDAAPPPASAPIGPPSWFPIGPDISQPDQLNRVDAGVLSLRRQPQWFLGMARTLGSAEYTAYWARMNPDAPDTRPSSDGLHVPAALPYPQRAEDIPLDDHGVSLEMNVSVSSDPDVLLLDLKLSSADQPLQREVQPRRTNALPFLFSICVDARPINIVATGGDSGSGGFGADLPYMIPLLNRGASRTWQIRLDARSLAAMMPDARAHAVAIVAAFSNRQHEVYFADDGIPLDGLIQPRGAQPDSQILVRSEAVRLQWTGERWTPSNSTRQ